MYYLSTSQLQFRPHSVTTSHQSKACAVTRGQCSSLCMVSRSAEQDLQELRSLWGWAPLSESLCTVCHVLLELFRKRVLMHRSSRSWAMGADVISCGQYSSGAYVLSHFSGTGLTYSCTGHLGAGTWGHGVVTCSRDRRARTCMSTCIPINGVLLLGEQICVV